MNKVGTIVRVSALILLITGIALIARPTLRPLSDDGYRCQQVIVTRELKPCLDYLIHGHSGAPLRLRLNDTPSHGSNSEVLNECCQRLQNFTAECRCDAIKQMLHEKKGDYRTEKMRGAVRRARNLPAMCSLEPHRCNFRIYSGGIEEIGFWKLYG